MYRWCAGERKWPGYGTGGGVFFHQKARYAWFSSGDGSSHWPLLSGISVRVRKERYCNFITIALFISWNSSLLSAICY